MIELKYVLTAWKVELRKHVFCSLIIPMGLRAVGKPSAFEAEEAVVSDTEPLREFATLAESFRSDDCDVEGRGVIDGEVDILAWRGARPGPGCG